MEHLKLLTWWCWDKMTLNGMIKTKLFSSPRNVAYSTILDETMEHEEIKYE
jgi:hypothetical protein